MDTSKFHLSMTTALAVGLGYALSSSMAVGYPSSSVSYGSNPVQSAAGDIDLHTTTSVSDVMRAPSDQDLIITDVMLGLPQSSEYCRGNGTVHLRDGAGNSYGEFAVGTTHMGNAQATPTTFHARSGLRVPAGTSITLSWTWDYNYCGTSTYDLVYTLGGYLAQP